MQLFRSWGGPSSPPVERNNKQVTSCPSVESIRKFIPEDELWPPKPSWGYHWADLDILQAHNYEVFGEDYTNRGMEEFVNATQIAQGTYFQYAMELYRTRKPKMSAVCFCHFILNSPDFKWATVDYYYSLRNRIILSRKPISHFWLLCNMSVVADARRRI